jgi:hypothetical protein
MMHIHWRLAELTILQQNRNLSEDELQEIAMCLKLNADYARKLAEQYNLCGIATMTNDDQWFDEILIEIDKLEIEYKIKKPTSQER